MSPTTNVTITDTITVRPPSSSSTSFSSDQFILELSHLDNDPNLRTTIRYLRLYSSSSSPSPSPFHVIADALSKTLAHYNPLSGSLRRKPGSDQLELVCEEGGGGVTLVQAVLDCELEAVGYGDDDDPVIGWVEDLVPDPGPDEGLLNPFVLQVTVFRCGGFCLGVAIHHALCDGIGATQFFTMMAELARGANHVSVEPVWDRARLLGPRDPPHVDVPLGELLSFNEQCGGHGYDSGLEVQRVSFDVKEEWLDRFKNRLSVESGGHNFTTFEALGAFIWHAKVKASRVPGGEIVKFVYSMNIRKIVKPALPLGYWGNGCVPIYVQLTAKDLLEQPMWLTADLIKKSKSQATDEYVRSFIDFQELNYDKGISAGKWVSGFTDWRHLGHSAIDFGWGGPVTVLPLSRNLLGSTEPCFFLPYSSARHGNKDGFKVLVTLQGTAVPSFREEMGKLSTIGLELGSSL